MSSANTLAPFAASLAILSAGCTDAPIPCAQDCAPLGASIATIAMDFTADGGFYRAPFPSDARVRADGTVDLEGFPNPKNIPLVQIVVGMLTAAPRGFGMTSGAFFTATGRLDPSSLPDLHASVATGSAVVLVGVDPAAPDYGKRYPISVHFAENGGPYGAPNLLAALPLQGVPLRPLTRYAVAVRTTVRDAAGAPLAVAPAMAILAAGGHPAGMSDKVLAEYQAAIGALRDAGIDTPSLAALTVYTTGSPEDGLAKVTAAMLADVPSPTKPLAPTGEVFPDFCVFATTIPMPEYQGGVPPYSDTGGGWVFDAAGKPALQRQEEANFVVTVPRAPMPAAGYPIVVMSRTGGGGERPLVDRGVQAVNGGPPITPGTGPALYFARAGFAGASIDGPHGGLRNITHSDEQFLMFNVSNPPALRDNVRQSAAELALEAHVLAAASIDVSSCPGATAPNGVAHFDAATMALMGHSMGATIAPLSLAVEPLFRAGLLSGAGGSWIENVIYKEHPLVVKGIAEVLLGLKGSGYSLNEHDPILSLYQWAGEEADPPVYGRRIVAEPTAGAPRHVLMMQGIVDSYIMPPIANATSLSFGLDLAGAELDATNPGLAGLPSLGGLLDLTGRKAIGLPAAANVETAKGAVTAVVTQHPEDGIENGHEVVFQTEAPKHEYRCFLLGLAKGAPRVPSQGKAFDPCD